MQGQCTVSIHPFMIFVSGYHVTVYIDLAKPKSKAPAYINVAWASDPVENQYQGSSQLQKSCDLNLSPWYGHVILVSDTIYYSS